MPSDAMVHVIDGDTAVRQSLTSLFTANRLAVRTHASVASFLDGLPRIRSGCVITEMRMPDYCGLDLLGRMRKMRVHLPVIVIATHDDAPLAVEAMRFGAIDFVEKPFSDAAILAAVTAALAHAGTEAHRESERAAIAARLTTLSRRERQVLDGLLAGRANKTMAFEHGISPRTIEIYRANLMAKMQAANLSDLMRMALLAGVADPAAKAATSGC